MVSGSSDLVDVAAEFRKDTGRAYMIYVGDDDAQGREIWVSLPKAITEWDGETTFTIPRRVAEEKELDPYII